MEPKKGTGKRMSVSFTADQASALERASAATGATQASILAIALDEWLRRRETVPASEDSVSAMAQIISEALGVRIGRTVAEEVPYGDGGVAIVIDGQAWAGCDAGDLQAAWRAWQAMTPDERARWLECGHGRAQD